ncbi:MAG: Asp-tRNA(Asn)/Glu-tRNA(Gln) amidotransferase subunit GatA [Bacteroidota bacterium]
MNSLPPTYSEQRKLLLRGEISAQEITEHYLSRIEQSKHLNAFLSVLSERARAKARSIDQQLRENKSSPLAGCVVAVKDNISIQGEKTTCASRILENFVAIYDATVIQRLEAAGAIIIGKTNLDEFAMGSSTENSAFGPVLNPIDPSRVPGGSSGGSAVAIAAGLAPVALGSDTGGSIRQPAALTGIIGLKPTYGRVSRYGLVAFASSFDQIGPFALSIEDIAHMMNVIGGYDRHDSTSAKIELPDFTKALDQEIKGTRIGIPKEYFSEGLDPEIHAAIKTQLHKLEKNGAIVEEITLPHTEYTIATYYILTTAEASSNLARYDGARYGHRTQNARDLIEMYTKSRSEGFGPEVKRRIMLGTYVLSAGYYEAYYRKAQKVRRLIKEDFDRAFQNVDVIITPTSPTTAFRLGEKVDDPLQMYLSDIYTTSANLAGIPGINIPAGKDSRGLPIGMQIMGKQFDEMTLLKISDFILKTQ